MPHRSLLPSSRPGVRAVLILSAAALAGLLAVGVPPSGADPADQPVYLALGGSASVGVQPTLEDPEGAVTRTGYTNDLEAMVRSRWPGLELTELGCAGESTGTMIAGGDRCPYPEGSQLAAADAFLRRHRNTRLVTIDLGFNDISNCFDDSQVDPACVTSALATIRQQLPIILSSLRSAGDSRVVFVGLGHYDPYLTAAREGGTGLSYAAETLRTIQQLNDTLRSVYVAYGIKMADVLTAFDGAVASSVLLDGHSLAAAGQRVCGLTWMCTSPPFGPNVHPNDHGYALMAQQLLLAVDQDP